MNIAKQIALVASGLGASALALPAFAVDAAPIVTELQGAQASVELIGAAVLMIAVVVAVFKYVRKAL